ncbi:methyl-accepting chemotaxis protein [Paludibacterium sp. THUN1379]|uniref:methyl-accepting chemotaxis protein n=1 Tax=Paludibacterium sp. THUN1379 TaxID=3112107 RepID=UPI003086B2BB|nr:methyl-accepting chemotaxis protein [Paludibacterium sp. THUN1379]
MSRLDHMNVRTRLGLALMTAFVCLLAFAAFALMNMRESQLNAHHVRIRNIVDGAAGITNFYVKQAQAGKMTQAEAQRQAREALRDLHYDGNNYVFIYDFDGRAVMVSGNPKLEGKVMLGKTDVKGFKLWDAIVSTATGPGSGYLSYWFPRAGSDVPLEKLGYIQAVPEWHWAIGTGVYVDDVNAMLYAEATRYGIGILISLLLAGTAGVVASRSIVRQLGGEPLALMGIMRRAAAGDLSTDFEVKGGDQSVLGNLKLMLQGLASLVRELGQVSAGLEQSASTVAAETNRVLAMAGHQADSVSSMAAAMEQMTVAVNHIADNARDSEGDSQAAAEQAKSGEERALSVVSKIQEVLTTSRGATESVSGLVSRADQIGTITAVIKEIAAQTNLLALNASIEAARAGEQGRGFAVVADEVRGLAERTARATVEIEQMIHGIQQETQTAVVMLQGSVPQADEGVELSNGTAQLLQQIRSGMQLALARVQDVAASTREQSLASSSIAQQVEMIASGVEETRASMARTADQVASLEQLSHTLQESVSRFRL